MNTFIIKKKINKFSIDCGDLSCYDIDLKIKLTIISGFHNQNIITDNYSGAQLLMKF